LAVKVLIIDPDETRASLVAEGLREVRPLEVRRSASLACAQTDFPEFSPDAVIIACESPDRDTLESLRVATDANPRPIIMFTDKSTPTLAKAAVEAGVAAYVVDGLSPKRVHDVLSVAMTRFELMQKLRSDLAKAHADLAARKSIERAKGILMKTRGLDEEAAYAALRKLAMDSGRPLGAVAADVVAVAGLITGGES
jgi:response regulator NasT